jgi:hypothetical protein
MLMAAVTGGRLPGRDGFCALGRGRQPLAAGVHPVGGLRQRRQRAPAGGAADGAFIGNLDHRTLLNRPPVHRVREPGGVCFFETSAPTPPWYFTFLPNCPQGFGGFSVMISVPSHDGRVSGPDPSIAGSDTAGNV